MSTFYINSDNCICKSMSDKPVEYLRKVFSLDHFFWLCFEENAFLSNLHGSNIQFVSTHLT